MSAEPFFSIVIATRDRPALFADALRSVAEQTCAATEIVVVIDGLADEHAAAYAQAIDEAGAALGDRLRRYTLVRRPRGHGQSYSLNYGVDQARGRYVGFLDDDDVWIDAGHLERTQAAIEATGSAARPVDLYMANQEAWKGPVRLPGPTWIEGLEPLLKAAGRAAAAHGAYEVGLADLLAVNGFCHLNALVVRRELYSKVGGMDEGIRWECDRDLYLRLLDAAGLVLHHPAIVSRHHVPDPKAGTSMTTSLGELERRLWQLRVLDKASLLLQDPALRAHGRLHKGYALKRIAQNLAAQGAWRSASAYARQALGAGPGFKWAAFTAWCHLKWLADRGAA